MKTLYIIFVFFISFLSLSNATPLQEIIQYPVKRFYRHKHYISTEVFHNYKNKRNTRLNYI